METSIQSHVPSLFPGCQGSRGRGGNDDGNDGGVYRYDYDDLDIRPTSSSTTPGGIGRNRFVCLLKSWIWGILSMGIWLGLLSTQPSKIIFLNSYT